MNNQEITPQPIEKLFELEKPNGDVWIKDTHGLVNLGKLVKAVSGDLYFVVNDEAYLKGDECDMELLNSRYESFIIAEIPKF